VGLAQFDARVEIDISDLVGNAAGGVTLTDIAKVGCGAADLFG
jgi:hypothetical protein